MSALGRLPHPQQQPCPHQRSLAIFPPSPSHEVLEASRDWPGPGASLGGIVRRVVSTTDARGFIFPVDRWPGVERFPPSGVRSRNGSAQGLPDTCFVPLECVWGAARRRCFEERRLFSKVGASFKLPASDVCGFCSSGRLRAGRHRPGLSQPRGGTAVFRAAGWCAGPAVQGI